MKDLIKFIGSCQNQYIAAIRQKKDAAHLGSVAGVDLGGEIPASEYGNLLANVDGYIKEAKRFKEDSSKIVLERNSLLRVLHNSNYVFFGNVKSDGETTIRTNKRFKDWLDMEYTVFPLLFVIFAAICLTIFTSDKNNISFRRPFPSIIFSIELIFLGWIIIHHSIKQLKYTKWLRGESQRPELLFQTNNDDSDGDKSIILKLDISSLYLDVKHINSTKWYACVLRETTVLASKIEGRIGWLWDCSAKNALDDNYKFNLGGYGNQASIEIQNNSDNLLCFIATKHSLVFHFPAGYDGIGGFESPMSDSEKERVSSLFEKEKEKMFLSY